MSSSKNYTIRIEYPLCNQTYFGNRIPLKGWILVPESTSASKFLEDFDINISISDIGHFNSVTHVGIPPLEQVVSSDSDNFYNDEIVFEESGEYLSPDLNENGEPKYTGKIINFSTFINKSEEIKGNFSLQVSFLYSNFKYTSNSVPLIFSDISSFNLSVKGGPISPLPKEIYPNYFFIKGWLYVGDREIESISAIIPDASSTKVSYGEKLSDLCSSLPDLQGTCGVQVLTKFEPRKNPYITSFNIQIKYKNSDEVTNLFWGNSLVLNNDPVLKIEHTERTLDHVIIKGYYSVFSSENVNFKFISSFSELNIPNEFLSLVPDINDYGLASGLISGKTNYKIKIPNSFFKGFLGRVNLVISYEGNSVSSYDSIIIDKLSFEINNISKSVNPSLSQGFGRLKYLAKKILIKNLLPDRFIKNSIKENNIKKDGIAFFYHNLSLTEGAPKVALLISDLISKQEKLDLSLSVAYKLGDGEEQVKKQSKDFLFLEKGQPNWKNFIQYKDAFRELENKIKKVSPKVSIVNSLDSFLAIDVLSFLNLESIWIIHESIDPTIWYLNLPLEIRSRFLSCLEKATKVVFVSESTKNLYSEYIPKENQVVIKNAIDLEKFETNLNLNSKTDLRKEFGINQDDIVFLAVGTTTERKGQDILLEELNIFKENLDKLNIKANWKLLIVGAREIPFLEKLKEMIDIFDIKENVILIPETKEVEKFYKVSDVFLLASREESSPLVILEAYASRLPVFSTKVFGLRDLIKDHLAVSFDPLLKGELASKLIDFIKNPEKNIKHLNNAYSFVKEEYSLTFMQDRYLELLKKLLP